MLIFLKFFGERFIYLVFTVGLLNVEGACYLYLLIGQLSVNPLKSPVELNLITLAAEENPMTKES